MAKAFNGQVPNLNYAVNRLNAQTGILQNLVETVQSVVDFIQGGAGQIAKDANVEKAVQWAVQKAQSHQVTYSQTNRNLKNPDGMSFDCSSFLITAFYVGGFDINATTTRDMRSGFTTAGWIWIPGTSFEASQLQRGDIMLNESAHTQMYIGNNYDVNCGSTPADIEPHCISYSFGGINGWDGVLRYDKQ